MPRWHPLMLVLAGVLLGLPAHALAQTGTPDAGSIPAQPLFSRHIVPLFSRLGCDAGACHGAVQGKGGFRLSLFGVDPQLDHERLLREVGGRRLNLHDADASLLLHELYTTDKRPLKIIAEDAPLIREAIA